MARQLDLQALKLLTVSDIVIHCRRETERFFQREEHDPRPCYELFRRAIVDCNQSAWACVYDQYHRLVTGWVERHPAYPASSEEVQFLVNRAFEKMWAALTPEKFSRFPNLKSLLRYLQMCVHSVILDQVRAAQRSLVDANVEKLAAEGVEQGLVVENQALSRVQRDQFWEQISLRLRDRRERRVVYGSFILALKPRELYVYYQETFVDVTEVYRVKQNVLARLRRDAELKKLLGQDA